jgi:hypothetical protein
VHAFKDIHKKKKKIKIKIKKIKIRAEKEIKTAKQNHSALFI